MIEGLEDRKFLSAKVTTVVADNRGEVIISLDKDVTGVSKDSVRMTTSGTDGTFGTADDVRVPASVRYDSAARRITIRGATDPNASYVVRLDAKKIRSTDGSGGLDGEFNGTSLPSGNNASGGNFAFRSVRDRGDTPRVRMSSNLGVINLRMRKDAAPISANAFLDIANAGDYDGMFIGRSVPGFVLQGGSLQVTGNGTVAGDVVANTATEFPEELPRVLTNIRGTLSFARGGAQSLASNQFFINLGNNSTGSSFNNLDVDDGGGDAVFTPFAEIADASGLAVADAIAAKPTANLNSQLTSQGAAGAIDLGNVPVNDTTQAQTALNPNRDLQVFRRVAVRMKITSVA
jgi:cyclophilin family peptidyl-prolyl cis-trans isomerase